MMKKKEQIIIAFVFSFFFLTSLSAQGVGKIFFREDFRTLERWEFVENREVRKATLYSIISDQGHTYLKAESRSSASALRYVKTFNVYEYPRMRWRWKVENVYEKGDATKKQGDDYPIRVYVVFRFNPQKVGFLKKLKYKTAGLFYSGEIPDSALNYIWANKWHQANIIKNPYRKEARMILLQKGKGNVGLWIDEDVNILEDYRKAFREDPPERASVVIMNDSDNTGESSVSYIDFIEIYR
ncbi:MAG: DUF3047 domain-containing protein [Candidatus Aureabacteria bacterium]|nr:DUF3047 domain-containing protein [Candidatus Auribacterota bacterium]